MSRPPKRLVVPEGSLHAGDLTLTSDLARYVRSVLRFGPDTPVIMGDGAGQEADAVITRVTKTEVALSVGPLRPVPRSGMTVILLQAIGKGDKMDAVVRPSTELGVARIVPVVTERAVSRQGSRAARWRTIAEDAVRVSGRAYRPKIDDVALLETALPEVSFDLGLVLALDGAESLQNRLCQSEIRDGSVIAVLIGPEGGLTADEVALAQSHGYFSTHLGPHTLRTETAGPAVIAMLDFWMGWRAGKAR